MNMKRIIILSLLFSMHADAGSFRCGTRIVVTGDSVNRLIKSCGKPSMTYKAQETVRSNGVRQSAGVTNWIYERGRKRSMVVSVRGGKVVKIATD